METARNDAAPATGAAIPPSAPRSALSVEVLTMLLVGVALGALFLTSTGELRKDLRERFTAFDSRLQSMESQVSSMATQINGLAHDVGEIRGLVTDRQSPAPLPPGQPRTLPSTTPRKRGDPAGRGEGQPARAS